jgi:hypothetical protein
LAANSRATNSTGVSEGNSTSILPNSSDTNNLPNRAGL